MVEEEEKKQQTNELIQQVINKLEVIRLLAEKAFINGNGVNKEFPWIGEAELEKLLGIHRRTLAFYRENQTLQFSRIGKKIFYNKREIEQLLQNRFGRMVKIEEKSSNKY